MGDHVCYLDYRHVKHCRGVKNSIRLKCNSSINSDELLKLIDVLNPVNETGRLISLLCVLVMIGLGVSS
ncbi:MAG: 3-deoxy-7-phosphoheptulonate synthase [Bartonella sp.]|nr:3-deoxy-7-phosphoheptulonate synthase [Bartonella sp.]